MKFTRIVKGAIGGAVIGAMLSAGVVVLSTEDISVDGVDIQVLESLFDDDIIIRKLAEIRESAALRAMVQFHKLYEAKESDILQQTTDLQMTAERIFIFLENVEELDCDALHALRLRIVQLTSNKIKDMAVVM